MQIEGWQNNPLYTTKTTTEFIMTTTTTLVAEAQATATLANSLTTEQRNQLFTLLDNYCGGSDISVSGFQEVVEANTGISDYLLCCLVMDNNVEQLTDDTDFQKLTEEEQEEYLSVCEGVLATLYA